MTKKNQKTGRNVVVLTALVCLLMLGGSIAWLTSKSELTNVFTVGEIKPVDPEKEPTGPTGPIQPDDPELSTKLNGNLYEPSWVANSKLMPGKNIKKDPYIGVGPKSEKSYVYMYVKNSMTNDGNDIYFTINEGWEAVEATSIDGGNKNYTGGLFRYTAGLDASNSDVNVWTTTPLFNEVIVKDTATSDDFKDKTSKDNVGTILVQSFLHQMEDEGKTIEPSVANAAAKAAFGINN